MIDHASVENLVGRDVLHRNDFVAHAVGQRKVLPGLVHRDDDARGVEQRDVGGQGIEDGPVGGVLAQQLGLEVNAGHGLTYQNVRPIAQIPDIQELNIGHSIVSRALFVGLTEAVREMKRLIETA